MAQRRADPVVGLIVLGLLLAGTAALVANRGMLALEDDAYYYTLVAENLARTGRSTFDGITLTNGYHPLWLLALTAMEITVGISPWLIAGLEIVLVAAAGAIFASLFRSKSLLLRIGFAVAFAILASPLVARGMEVSLTIFALSVLVRVAQDYRAGDAGGLALGLAAAFAIASRIDAAVFAVPMVLLAAGNVRNAVGPLSVIGVFGMAYAVTNQLVFGLPFPVSGAVKSLGGLQFNALLFAQMAEPWQSGGLLYGPIAFLKTIHGKLAAMTVLAAFALVVGGRAWNGQRIAAAYLIGMTLYAGKLLFASSWVIWSWYAFPIFVGLFLVASLADEKLASGEWHASVPETYLRAAAGLVLAIGLAWVLRSNGLGKPAQTNFDDVNRDAARVLAPVLQGSHVAMGDRAGSFAAAYGGPVSQLEGLVNDKAYLETLRARADVRPLLCARGVQYVLAYQPDLGSYDKATVPLLRPALTQFKMPGLTVTRADEVARYSDLGKFDNTRVTKDGDSFLYAWRLSGGPTKAVN